MLRTIPVDVGIQPQPRALALRPGRDWCYVAAIPGIHTTATPRRRVIDLPPTVHRRLAGVSPRDLRGVLAVRITRRVVRGVGITRRIALGVLAVRITRTAPTWVNVTGGPATTPVSRRGAKKLMGGSDGVHRRKDGGNGLSVLRPLLTGLARPVPTIARTRIVNRTAITVGGHPERRRRLAALGVLAALPAGNTPVARRVGRTGRP